MCPPKWERSTGSSQQSDWAFRSSGGLLSILALVAVVIFAFSGNYPRGLFDLLMGLNRWVYRVYAYMMLMTDEYPPRSGWTAEARIRRPCRIRRWRHKIDVDLAAADRRSRRPCRHVEAAASVRRTRLRRRLSPISGMSRPTN